MTRILAGSTLIPLASSGGISFVTVQSRAPFFRLLGVCCFVALVAACATAPPVQEMSDARQAIAAAKEAGAETLAADQLGQAEQLLESAENYLQTGGSSNYWNAQQAAINAKKVAFDALLASRSARESKDTDSSE